MPDDVVNLNKFKKAKSRAEKAKRAAENRVRFGRTKGEKAKAARETARREALLDGVRHDQGREPDGRTAPQAVSRDGDDA